jgi:uncharacterized repeat protein (TIGR01451 family)
MKIRFLLAALGAAVLTTSAFAADDAAKDVKGIYLLSDYPAVTVQPGTTATVSLNLRNYDVAPDRFALSVDGVPSGWTATLLGGGQPVAAAMPETGGKVSLDLRIDVPKDAKIATQTLTVKADSGNTHVARPLAVTLAKDLPAKLSLQPQLPALRGSTRSSFDYTLSIKNDSGKKLLVSLAAQAPLNFDTSFTEAYGTQELSSIPIEAGKSKDVKLKVKPPENADAGNYAVTAKVAAGDATATSALKLELTGTPDLAISGREGLLSARATAGRETSVPVVVTNNGTAPAENVKMSGTAPSGWKVTFQPDTIAKIAPNQKQEVQALLTPPAKAIAGDYVTSLRAATGGNSESANFRVTVSTSTMWGIVGAGIIGAALLIMVGAVSRFGRR